jgi:coenzyme F420-dependent glucose-6-phosphate dehydrogenase
LSPEEKTGVEDPIEMQQRADALPIDRAASRFIVSSDPDEHVAAIWRYVELGFTHLVFHAPGPDQARFLDLYGQEILPRLRKRAAASR